MLIFVDTTFANETISYFTTSDGIKIGYIQYGNENLPNLVFIHGGPGDNSADFRRMGKQLASNFHVTLYDSRGCGLSTKKLNVKDLKVSDYINDLKELLNHLEIDSTILLGHSFGGAIAIEFAVAYPGIVKQLVLANPFLSGLKIQKNRFEQSYQYALKENDTVKINAYHKYKSGDSITIWDEAKMTDARLRWYNPEIIDSVFSYDYKSLGYTKKNYEAGGFDIVIDYYKTGFFPFYSVIDKLSQLKVETIIISASHDFIISELDLKQAANLIPKCELHRIDKCGHIPYLERPDEFRKLIITVCSRT